MVTKKIEHTPKLADPNCQFSEEITKLRILGYKEFTYVNRFTDEIHFVRSECLDHYDNGMSVTKLGHLHTKRASADYIYCFKTFSWIKARTGTIPKLTQTERILYGKL